MSFDDKEGGIRTKQPPYFPSTSSPLVASSFWIHSYCKVSYDAYMRCKKKSQSTTTASISCLEEAKKVFSCSKDFFKKIEPHCSTVFRNFFKCLDMNNEDFKFCRMEEDLWDLCAKDKMGIEGKRLWRGESPTKDGFKPTKDGPELVSKAYRKHCQNTKVK